jgi:hypothetical protein
VLGVQLRVLPLSPQHDARALLHDVGELQFLADMLHRPPVPLGAVPWLLRVSVLASAGVAGVKRGSSRL